MTVLRHAASLSTDLLSPLRSFGIPPRTSRTVTRVVDGARSPLFIKSVSNRPTRSSRTPITITRCLAWRGHPDVVSKGAQKNFAQFALFIGSEWTRQPDAFNETYFRQGIVKAIVFRKMERLVTDQPWYQGGYRANVVASAIAKLEHDPDRFSRSVDFDGIWRAQGISPHLRDGFTIVAKAVHNVIVEPPDGISNVTEWAKQQACWNRVAALTVAWPKVMIDEFISKEDQRETKKTAVKDQKMLNGIDAQTAVVKAGGQLWRS